MEKVRLFYLQGRSSVKRARDLYSKYNFQNINNTPKEIQNMNINAGEELINISDSMCRTCLKKEADKNLFDEHKPSSLEYSSILESCISIKVTKVDGLPTKICGTCLKKLLSFHNFKIAVIENEFKLRKSMKICTSRAQGIEDQMTPDNIPAISVKVTDYVETERRLEYASTEKVKIVHPGISPDDLTFVTDSDSTSGDETSILKDETDPSVGDKQALGDECYQCDICHESFTTKRILKDHYGSHTGERPYSCDVCSKKFSKAEHVLIHKRIHTGERPHKCLICKKRFIQFATLKAHIKSHTNTKTHICNICGKTFSQSSTLGMHMRVHTDERPYVCQICEKTFRNRGNLITHVRFHKNERLYGCDQCDRRFITSSHLNIHARQHSGERPYKCVVCSKTFGRSEHLKGHLVTHSGLKPFQCESCPRRYRQRSHLRRHARTAHVEVGGGRDVDDGL